MDEQSVSVKRLQSLEDAQKAYCCMTESPTPWTESLCLCRDWIATNLGHFVDGYHLEKTDSTVIGHLYFAKSEWALFPYKVEPGVGVLYCDWVHQPYQGAGYGKKLFEKFISDLEKTKTKGILVEATEDEGQMHFRHYLKRGFNPLLEQEKRRLLYYPISQETVSAVPLEASIQPRKGLPVEIHILNGYMCPFEVSTMVLLREIMLEFSDRVTTRDIKLTPDSIKRYGTSKGIFINGRQKLFGGESEEAIRVAIIEEF